MICDASIQAQPDGRYSNNNRRSPLSLWEIMMVASSWWTNEDKLEQSSLNNSTTYTSHAYTTIRNYKHLKLIKPWDILVFQQCDPTARVHRWSRLYTMAVRFWAAWKFDDLVSNRRLFNGRQCRIYFSKNCRKKAPKSINGQSENFLQPFQATSLQCFHAKQT